jgi:hypothetical protein
MIHFSKIFIQIFLLLSTTQLVLKQQQIITIESEMQSHYSLKLFDPVDLDNSHTVFILFIIYKWKKQYAQGTFVPKMKLLPLKLSE